MKTLKLFLIFIITLVIFQSNVFSTITSRIEGMIIDADTKKCIKGAKVWLYKYSESDRAFTYTNFIYVLPGKGVKPGTRYSDEVGRFRFDDVLKGQFFLAVFKEGYGTYGPLLSTWETSKSINKNVMGKVDRFHIREGEIKHIKIRLKKEAVLKIILKMKIPQGIIPYPEFVFRLKHTSYWPQLERTVDLTIKYREKSSRFIVTDEYIRTLGLNEGSVELKIVPYGYPEFSVSGIILNTAQETIIERTLDFTKGQVIHGIIKDNNTGSPIRIVSVRLYGKDEPNKHIKIDTFTNNDGEFWIGGIEPGTYKLVLDKLHPQKKFYFEQILQIPVNSVIEIRKEF